jgi:methionyl aminopeptidase
MVTLGTWKTKILQDGWTVVTTDSSIAAHFEHTIAITENGPELLTTLDEVDQTIAVDPIIR